MQEKKFDSVSHHKKWTGHWIRICANFLYKNNKVVHKQKTESPFKPLKKTNKKRRTTVLWEKLKI